MKGQSSPQLRNSIKEVKKKDFSQLFGKYLPCYKELLVDAEGNILVFTKSDCMGDCPLLFQVYSPEGEYICETRLEPGDFGFEVDSRIKNMCFTDKGIFFLAEEINAEEFILRLIRVDVK
jgi:hypothetical protein